MKQIFSAIAIGLCVFIASCASTSTGSKTFKLSKAGFAEVERVPATKRPMPEASKNHDWSDSMRRSAQQNEFLKETTALMEKLRAEEPENFVQLRIEWEPEFHYLVLFKHAPEQTLARYTQNPIYKPTGGSFTEEELQAHMDIIWKRLAVYNAVNSGNLDLLNGRVELQTGLTRAEFDAISELGDLHDDPKLKLGFVAPFEPLDTIDPALARHIRYLSRADHLNSMVLTSLTMGRIVLRDGCFFLDRNHGEDPLVHFHKEVGIGFDTQGYIVMINRLSNVGRDNRMVRVGEWAGWGDGIHTVSEPKVLIPLHNACGVHPVVRIGTPSSLFGEKPNRR